MRIPSRSYSFTRQGSQPARLSSTVSTRSFNETIQKSPRQERASKRNQSSARRGQRHGAVEEEFHSRTMSPEPKRTTQRMDSWSTSESRRHGSARDPPETIQRQNSIQSWAPGVSYSRSQRSLSRQRRGDLVEEHLNIQRQSSTSSWAPNRLMRLFRPPSVARLRIEEAQARAEIQRQNSALTVNSEADNGSKTDRFRRARSNLSVSSLRIDNDKRQDDENSSHGGRSRASSLAGDSPSFSTRRLNRMAETLTGRTRGQTTRGRSITPVHDIQALSPRRAVSFDAMGRKTTEEQSLLRRTPCVARTHSNIKSRQDAWLKAVLEAIAGFKKQQAALTTVETVGSSPFDEVDQDNGVTRQARRAHDSEAPPVEDWENDPLDAELRNISNSHTLDHINSATFTSGGAGESSLLAENYTEVDDDDSVASLDLLCKWLTCERIDLTDAEVQAKKQRAIQKGKLQGVLIQTMSGSEFIVPTMNQTRSKRSSLPSRR